MAAPPDPSRALDVRVDAGVARVALDREAVHNAFDDAMVAELTGTLRVLDADAGVRAVVLRGNGASFCAGADLTWMRRMASYDHAQNLADANALAAMLATLANLSKPVIARVHGAAYGGVHARNNRLRQIGKRGEHGRQRVRVGEVLRIVVARHPAHPREVGARAEARAVVLRGNGAHPGVGVQRAQRH